MSPEELSHGTGSKPNLLRGTSKVLRDHEEAKFEADARAGVDRHSTWRFMIDPFPSEAEL